MWRAARGGVVVRAGVAGALALLGKIPIAHAASPAERVALAYDAPSGCPDVDSFVRQVRAREPRFEPSPGAPRAWEVALVARGGVVEGRLTTTDGSGARATRSFSGATCEEVLGALVLVATLALDAGPPPSAPSPTPPAPAAPESARVSPSPNEAPASASHNPFRLGADVRGFVTEAVAPNPLTGLAVRVVAEWGERWLSPVVRVGAAWGVSATADVPGGAARFTWSVVTFDGCPVRLRRGGLSLAPCVRFDAGQLRGVGYIVHPSSVTDAWADVGVVVEGRWVFARPFYAAVDGGLLVPLTQVRYHFDTPDVPVHTAEALEGTAGLGLGTYFW